jgi:hypothetical protein
MIVWFNCKITDVRLTPESAAPRLNLRLDSRFDIARYTIASYVPLEPLISKIIFNLELAEPYNTKEKQQEMEDWITGLFPAEKLKIFWHRCNYLKEWREIQPEIDAVDDDLIFIAGSDDYVFIDSDTSMYEKGLALLSADPSPRAALLNCHYPETLKEAYTRSSTLTECGNFLNFNFIASYGFAVIKKELYHSFLDNLDPNKFVFRLDGWEYTDYYEKWYVPTKELNRHYDGYHHAGIDPNKCSPLEIPKGFFEKNMTIRYGFDDLDPDCVNINPLSTNLRIVDDAAADFKYVLEDIPAFWKPYIKNIEIADNIDHNVMALARDNYFVTQSSACVNVPIEWIQNHLLTNR